MASPMRKLHCANRDCPSGYVCRATRKHLDAYGPPICPACHQVMASPEHAPATALDADAVPDFLADLERDAAQSVRLVDSAYRRLRKSRPCSDCGRLHDRTHTMLWQKASVRGTWLSLYFCAEGCDAPVASDPPGGALPPCRITEDHLHSGVAVEGEGHTWSDRRS